MKNCKHCGKELNEWGASTCPHCHKKQDLSFLQIISVIFVIIFIPVSVSMIFPQIEKKIEENKKSDISIIENDSNKPFDENNINKKVRCNGREILIKKIQRVNKSTNSYIPQNEEWIGIYIIYRNISDKDIYHSETDFHLVNHNKVVLNPVYNIIEGMFNHERLNNGTLAAGGKAEGYVIFANDMIGDKDLTLRFTCEENLISDDKIATVELK